MTDAFRYSRLQIALHWLTALAIAVGWLTAQAIDAVPTPSADAAPRLRRPASDSCEIMKKFGPGVIAATR